VQKIKSLPQKKIKRKTPKLYKAHRSTKFLKTTGNLPETLPVWEFFDRHTEPRRGTSIFANIIDGSIFDRSIVIDPS